MYDHVVGTREEWLAASKELLAAEKLFRRLEKSLTPTPAAVDAKLATFPPTQRMANSLVVLAEKL